MSCGPIRLASATDAKVLLEIAQRLFDATYAFGRLSGDPTSEYRDPKSSDRASVHLTSRRVPISVVALTLQDEIGLGIQPGAVFLFNGATWPAGLPLAGYSRSNAAPSPFELLSSLFSNWEMDFRAQDVWSPHLRVLRSALTVLENGTLEDAAMYCVDILEQGLGLRPDAVAIVLTDLLGARSHAASDSEAGLRLRGGPPRDAREVLVFYPERDWFDREQLSDAMRAVQMLLVERALDAVESAREAPTLDDFLVRLTVAAKAARAVQLSVKWTCRSVPISLAAILSQLEEIQADAASIAFATALGSFAFVIDYARDVADGYRKQLGDTWEDRFWRERAIIPTRGPSLTVTRVPADWVQPSWRIAAAWTAIHTFDDDPMLLMSRFADGRFPSDKEVLQKAPPAKRRQKLLKAALRGGQALSGSNDLTGAEIRFTEFLTGFPWCDPVYFERARLALGDIGEPEPPLGQDLAVLDDDDLGARDVT